MPNFLIFKLTLIVVVALGLHLVLKRIFRWIIQSLHFKGVQLNPVAINAIGKLTTLGIVFLAIVWMLHSTGVNILPLLTLGGISAAALGFAAKDSIANFIGGLMLYITRPFTLGEEILIEKEKIQGIVEQIGWYSTAIRDREKRVVFLPNSAFSHLLVVNCSRRAYRRIYETFFIDERHFDELGSLIAAIETELDGLTFVDPEGSCLASLEHISEGRLELTVELYISKLSLEEYKKARQEVLLILLRILKQQKISLTEGIAKLALTNKFDALSLYANSRGFKPLEVEKSS